MHAVDNLLLYLVKEGNKCPKKMDELAFSGHEKIYNNRA